MSTISPAPSSAVQAADASDVAERQCPPSARKSTRTHIRGSSLLLVGRMVALVLNLGTQVLLARYLSKTEFGAFAYALALATMAAAIVSLGLDKSARRFVPIYYEHRDYQRMFGTIVLSIVTTLALGCALLIGMLGLHNLLTGVVGDKLTSALVVLLIALAPVEALNRLCGGMMATFAGAKAIFYRRHVAGPALKLLIVGLLVALGGSVYVLAVGYLVIAIGGVIAYYAYLVHVLKRQGLWQQFDLRRMVIPAAEVYRFSLPLLSSDAALAARGFLAVYFLGLYHTPSQVALLRVVLPLAGVNKVVMETFQSLYMPLAAKLFARNDRRGIDELYWGTTLWISVLTFPIFLVTFALAEPVTVLLVGERYRAAGGVLAWLSLGFFLNAILGFNMLTLKVFGDVRNIVVNDTVATAATLALCFALIPTYGAYGAAIASCAALAFHNVLNQVSLLRISGITLFPRRCVVLYAVMLLVAVAVTAIQWTYAPPVMLGFVVCASGALIVLLFARGLLDINDTFPELARWPALRWLFASPKGVT